MVLLVFGRNFSLDLLTFALVTYHFRFYHAILELSNPVIFALTLCCLRYDLIIYAKKVCFLVGARYFFRNYAISPPVACNARICIDLVIFAIVAVGYFCLELVIFVTVVCLFLT